MTSPTNEPAVPLEALIRRWRDDPGGTYRTWFLWEERLKNFRSIRRGLGVVVDEIAKGTFGNVYRGSSLEVVVGSIAEQRQMFKGADHAFLWKPKLRIPDIYDGDDRREPREGDRGERGGARVPSVAGNWRPLLGGLTLGVLVE